MGRYRKKPVEIEAVEWTGYNQREIEPLADFDQHSLMFLGDELTIRTLEGDLHASVGDWIIRGMKGELYPVSRTSSRRHMNPPDAQDQRPQHICATLTLAPGMKGYVECGCGRFIEAEVVYPRTQEEE